MDSIIHYLDYKEFVRDYRSEQPSGGHGFFQKMALHLNVVPVIISQVFRGDRDLTPEQALELTDFLKLSKLESRYFLLLVQQSRAGSEKLRIQISEELNQLRKQFDDLSLRLPKDAKLDETAKAQFYSDWTYSAVRICTDIPQISSIEAISQHLKIPREKVESIVEFLLKNGLIVSRDNKLKVGPQRTHLESSSRWIQQHHQNWRRRAIEKMSFSERDDLFYSGPMTLAKKDFLDLKEQLSATISEVVRVVGDSKSEDLYCLNLDWFRLIPSNHK